MSMDTVPAANFCATLAANVDNARLSDAEFRQFVRNSLPIVDHPRPAKAAPVVLEDEADVRAAFAALEARTPETDRAKLTRLMHMAVEGDVHSFKHRDTRKGFEFDARSGAFRTEDREGVLTDPGEVLRWIASEE